MVKRGRKILNSELDVKTLTVILVILLVLAGLVAYAIFSEDLEGEPLLSPGEGYVIPLNCSDDSIKGLWDSVFLESSNGITIFVNDTVPDKCGAFFGYKVVDDSFFMLQGLDFDFLFDVNMTLIQAVHGNATEDYLSLLLNVLSLK